MTSRTTPQLEGKRKKKTKERYKANISLRTSAGLIVKPWLSKHHGVCDSKLSTTSLRIDDYLDSALFGLV